MAIWLTRAGKHGEHEQKFLGDNKIYVCWNDLNHDLSKLEDQAELRSILGQVYANAKKGRL